MKKILGIDYGEKRIGLALGLPEEKMAFPWKIIANKSWQKLLPFFRQVIQEEEIEKVVIGMPYSLQEKEKLSAQAKEIQNFFSFLQKNLPVPVEGEDERLTSRLAASLRQDAKRRDDVAAQLILTSYLERNY